MSPDPTAPVSDGAPLLSIIIASRNMATQLEDCLHNLLRSRLPSFEVLVIDGASEDNTVEVLKRYSRDLAFWVSEPDRGVYDAFNKAVLRAHGQFCYFLGADDRLTEDLLLLSTCLTCQDTVYYGDVVLAASGKIYDGPFSRSKLARTNICQQAVFYPRSIFTQYAFSLNYPIQADWLLNMQLAADPHYSFQYIPIQVAQFSGNGMSSTRADEAFNRDYLLLVRDNFPWSIYLSRCCLFTVLGLMKCILPGAVVNRLNKLSLRL